MVNNVAETIQWRIISELAEFTEFLPIWQEFEPRCQANLFSSSAWITTWIDIYWQDNFQLKVLIAERNGEILAIAPLYLQAEPSLLEISKLLPLGQGEPEASEVLSEFQDLVVGDIDSDFYRQLAIQISQLNYDEFVCKNILASSHWVQVFQHLENAQTTQTGKRFLIPDNQEYLDSLSKNNRAKWKRSLKKLQIKAATFKWLERDDVEHHWQSLIRMHQKRWAKKGLKGAFSHPDFLEFHQKIQYSESILMSALIVDGKPAAINYYLCDGDILYFYQSGWDQEHYASDSPGYALHIWSILNNPLQVYDFMVGELQDSYKQAFTSGSAPAVVQLSSSKNRFALNGKYLINKLRERILGKLPNRALRKWKNQ